MTYDKSFIFFIDTVSKFLNLESVKTIFDIGSRDCQESLAFRQLFPNANIVAFEPNPIQIDVCKENVKNTNIRLEQLALSNKQGELDFYITNGNIGASSLLEPQFVPWTPNQQVTRTKVIVQTLDDWCLSNNLYPDIIWIDVQGNELNTFLGGKRTLKNVKAIYTEAGLIPYYKNHTLKKDIVNLLEGSGFTVISDIIDWEREANLILVKNEFNS